MGGLLRKLAIFLCAPIYKLIPQIYNIFYILSNHRFFTDDTIDKISNNIYVLISVVMLFAFSANILAAIANPDLLTDKKKGVAALFKRAIIGLVLIIIIPFAFDYAYVIQENVIGKSLIEKIVVGINYTDEGSTNAGQVIAGSLISSVLHPVSDEVEISEDISEYYSSMVQTDIKDIDIIKYHINVTNEGGHNEKMFTDSENYAFAFDGLIAIGAGGACCYILIIFAIDMAVRIFKLAFLELTSPIIVVSYMCVGDDIFKKWIQETGKTFADVFVRIASIAFFIFLVGHLDGFLDNIAAAANDAEATGTINNFGLIDSFFLKTFLIIGMLIFVKQIPNFISKVLGINIESKGGIGGRLGEMYGVGKLAQSAWKGIRNLGLAGMAATGLAVPAAIGAGVGLGVNKATNGGLVDGLRKAGKGLSTFGKTTGSVLKGLASDNPITAIPNAVKGFKDSEFGKQNQKLSGIKKNEALLSSVGLDEIGSLNTDTIDGANAAVAELQKKISAAKISAKAEEILNQKIDAERVNSIMQKLKTSNDDIKDLLSTAASNAKTRDAQIELENLKQSFMTGNESLGSLTTKLNGMVRNGTLSEGSAKEIVSKINKIDSISQSKEFKDLNEKLEYELISSTGEIKTSKIVAQAKKTEDKEKVVKDKYDATLETVSDKEKEEIERLASVGESVNSEYVRKNSGKRGDEYTYKIEATSPTSQNTEYTDEEIMDMMSEAQASNNDDPNE